MANVSPKFLRWLHMCADSTCACGLFECVMSKDRYRVSGVHSRAIMVDTGEYDDLSRWARPKIPANVRLVALRADDIQRSVEGIRHDYC